MMMMSSKGGEKMILQYRTAKSLFRDSSVPRGAVWTYP
jgi:hypothetical protein